MGDKLNKKFGADVYNVKRLTNQHGATNTSVLWIGRSPDAAVWGKANDICAAEIASEGQSAQLSAEIGECALPLSFRFVSRLRILKIVRNVI